MSDDRRRSDRLEIEIEGESETLKETDFRIGEKVVTRNISTGGAYLLTPEPPAVGDLVKMTSGISFSLIGRVKRLEERNDGLHGFAVRFVDPDYQETGVEEAHLRKAWSLELKKLSQEGFESRARLKRVQDYIQENYSQDLGLSEVAAVAALESTYFSSLFHEKVGVTFSEWLQYVRVAKALEMMSLGDYSVTEVANAVGFNNLRSFERTFRKWTNMTPRTFKKLCRPDRLF